MTDTGTCQWGKREGERHGNRNRSQKRTENMEQPGTNYCLTLDLLLKVLVANHSTCLVVAEGAFRALIQTAKGGPKETMHQIELAFHSGKIVSALVRDRTGNLLVQGNEALIAGNEAGSLLWHVQPLVLPQPQTASGMPSGPRPRRTRDPRPEDLSALTREERRVLLLVDGRRDVQTLAALSHMEPHKVITMLKQFADAHFIHF
jgi:hypothetical protein